jgi:hypothetical protein
MEKVKDLIVICQFEDSAYKCTVSLYDNWTQTWEENVPYIARSGDYAPVNVWILEQIATGAYNPIDTCPLPPEPTQPFGDVGPTVA